MDKKMLFLFNPVAGRGAMVDHLYEAVDQFVKAGYRVEVHPTQAKRDAYDVTAAWGAEFDCIVCSGGDGTLNEVVDALMLMERRPMLGYIPTGSTNDFAYSLGLSDDVLLAAKNICGGSPSPIDVGQFGSEYFTYVAAFGLFTDVSYGTRQSLKNMLGHAAYVLEGVKRLPFIKAHRCTVVCDGEEITDDFIFGMVSNSTSIGGFRLPLSEAESRQGDGKFEVILLKNLNNILELQPVVATLLGSDKPCDHIVVRTAREIQIRCEHPLDWTLDGEFGGSHQDVDIKVHPHAVRILTP